MGPTMDPAPAYLLIALLACIAYVAAHLGCRAVDGESPEQSRPADGILRRAIPCHREDGRSWVPPTTGVESRPANRSVCL